MYNSDLKLITQLLKTHKAYVCDVEKHLDIEQQRHLEAGINHLDRVISILEKELESGLCNECGYNM